MIDGCSRLEHMDAAGIVSRGPVLLHSMSFSSTSASKVATVYDGLNTSGRKRGIFNVGASGNIERRFDKPVLFETGIYVDFTDTAITGNFEIQPVEK